MPRLPELEEHEALLVGLIAIGCVITLLLAYGIVRGVKALWALNENVSVCSRQIVEALRSTLKQLSRDPGDPKKEGTDPHQSAVDTRMMSTSDSRRVQEAGAAEPVPMHGLREPPPEPPPDGSMPDD